MKPATTSLDWPGAGVATAATTAISRALPPGEAALATFGRAVGDAMIISGAAIPFATGPHTPVTAFANAAPTIDVQTVFFAQAAGGDDAVAALPLRPPADRPALATEEDLVSLSLGTSPPEARTADRDKKVAVARPSLAGVKSPDIASEVRQRILVPAAPTAESMKSGLPVADPLHVSGILDLPAVSVETTKTTVFKRSVGPEPRVFTHKTSDEADYAAVSQTAILLPSIPNIMVAAQFASAPSLPSTVPLPSSPSGFPAPVDRPPPAVATVEAVGLPRGGPTIPASIDRVGMATVIQHLATPESTALPLASGDASPAGETGPDAQPSAIRLSASGVPDRRVASRRPPPLPSPATDALPAGPIADPSSALAQQAGSTTRPTVGPIVQTDSSAVIATLGSNALSGLVDRAVTRLPTAVITSRTAAAAPRNGSLRSAVAENQTAAPIHNAIAPASLAERPPPNAAGPDALAPPSMEESAADELPGARIGSALELTSTETAAVDDPQPEAAAIQTSHPIPARAATRPHDAAVVPDPEGVAGFAAPTLQPPAPLAVPANTSSAVQAPANAAAIPAAIRPAQRMHSDTVETALAGPFNLRTALPEPPAVVSAAAPAGPSAHVATQPHQLAHDVGLAIARQIAAEGNALHIRLEPAELGRIDVRMSFDDKGNLRAVLAVDSTVSLDLLRRDSADLGRAMSDAGVRSDDQSFRFEGRGERRGEDPGQQRLSRSNFAGAEAEPVPEIPDPTRFRPLRWRGQVDVLA